MTNQAEFSATGLSNGNVFVVWWSNQAGTYDIYGRLVAPDGSVISNEFLANQNTAGSQYYPSVAALNNSSALVAWQGSAWEIYGRVFDLSDPTTVTTGAFITSSQMTNLQAITAGFQPTSSVLVPTLLGVGGAVLGISLGGTLLTACVVGGICGIKLYS